MRTQEMFRSIASLVQMFKDIEQKEKFLFVLGALFSRVISLKKASEIMEIEPQVFLKILDLMGIEFSYLSPEDVALEKNW
ncbi:MAG: hypothetical protein DSM106950_18000 [Stigonema ocellatum SAG 48.90 = DSM 106950]|nr:hypothetical protein [Stigonema ocellatum SAG 48.90 = DSM 106950]